MAPYMSTIITRGVVRYFSLISKSNKVFRLLILISASKGRVEI